MPPTAGSSTGRGAGGGHAAAAGGSPVAIATQSPSGAGPERARFHFDLASPTCWLVAERILQVMPVATEWIPVHLATGPVEGEAFRCSSDEQIWRGEIERRARALELQDVRWPDPFPFDSGFAMRAATFARGTGRTVAFALAAFRQAFCGGRALDEDTVLIAAAACELHPAAVLKGAALRSTAEALARESAAARLVPEIVMPDGRRYAGEDAPERAAAALATA